MFEKLKSEITVLIENSKEVNQTLTSICDALKSKIPHYDWVGFYFKNDKKRELILGPYAGKPTDHSTIPFGRGICGQVAVNNKNFVVPDVQAQDNYRACSLEVKSEIVIPIFVKGENIGQIDIDSNTLNPFSKADETFLEFICAKVATLL
ncbi:MAG: GAF domain-containing protein [Bacteroidota bacterium]|nr:GAF domain-containing protein [Bacteroidota bacterium]